MCTVVWVNAQVCEYVESRASQICESVQKCSSMCTGVRVCAQLCG